MYAQFYYIRLVVDAITIAVDLIAIGVWSYAWMRIGSLSFLLLALASVGAFFLALVGTAFAYDFTAMKRFDPHNVVYGFSWFVVQPCIAVIAITGQILL